MSTSSPGENHLADIATLSYEQARAELVDVVQRLEQGAATLEDSLTLWERGEALATRCQTWLDGARERLRAASNPTAPGDRPGDVSRPDPEEPRA
ncbi:exodeoxyribonuclease VII small subunit [Salana multivorans]|uniref:Exodeoxyribonuclease 7 small subunit n=1 Tax=Salana multivorans TaxID=120377 RepID=A0A3N2D7P3_9MICO|nr:exodeoxyribonuclease VII small subunit [Salana multivorans]MBN8882334.1 exodeoxyribonuclease VII small subunit [Salana multivorans]OJX98471.1 MAG: exodeoxyribonuclease VII small subunit [Micrococcales bacterium 73-15]ROR95816.1 exodeoxyribonuclease VII small subunit [Salana multivorans]